MVPGASLLLRRPAAVVAAFGVVSRAGVLRTVTAGVDVRPRACVIATAGSADAANERREGGRDTRGGVDSAFGATEGRGALKGRLGDIGEDSEDMVGACGWTFSLSGIFLVAVSVGAEVEKGEGFGASFCFFFFGSISADGEADAFESSSFRFFDLAASFLPVDLGPLVIGELVWRCRFARALDKGLKRFLNEDPSSPSLRAASSASCAAWAACSRARVSLFNFLAWFSFMPRFLTAVTSIVPAAGSPTRALSSFDRLWSRSSTSRNSVPLRSEEH